MPDTVLTLIPGEAELIASLSKPGPDRERLVAKFYWDNWPKVRSFVRQNSGTDDDARDVIQEGIKRLIVSIIGDTFRGSSSLSTFLNSICRNFWLTELKRQKYGLNYQDAKVKEEAPMGESPQTAMEREERNAFLGRAMARLDHTCGEALRLRYFYDMSLPEIAKKMAIENTDIVKTKLYRCKEKLKGYIQPGIN